jgi:ATP-dependent RNA helicase DeaD
MSHDSNPSAGRDGEAGGPVTSDDGGPGEATAGFPELGLADELVATLAALGYEEPTPIQREAVPHLLAGRDLLGQAATGTGKTAAFALPMLHRLGGRSGRGGPVGLVLVPTRELAVQVSEATHRYGQRLGARVLPVYGGAPMGRQIRSLSDGVDIVVATPGRAMDLMERGPLRLDAVHTVVLDEADEMLDMGFAEDIEAILGQTPPDRQTVLFSATMPKRIERLAQSHLTDAVRVALGREKPAAGEAPKVRQVVYFVPRQYKPAALGRLLDVEAPDATIVFCRTRAEVDTLTVTLNGRGYRAEALHGGLTQDQRDRVMGRLRQGTSELLVATDVAARGLDIDQLTHVVNYDVPAAPEAYVHRIGRVGRAGREGVAITLAEPREHRQVGAIERATGTKLARESVPTVADLRQRRLELTRASLREALLSDDHERFRVVVESLSDEFDVMDVALAAVKLAHEAVGGETDDDVEIPEARTSRQSAGSGARSSERSGERRAGGQGSGSAGPATRLTHGERIFVGAGRQSNVRPNDLVGAIANESSLRGRDIGAIEIFEKFSLVEVPADKVDEVIAALRRTTLRGRRPSVRRDRA